MMQKFEESYLIRNILKTYFTTPLQLLLTNLVGLPSERYTTDPVQNRAKNSLPSLCAPWWPTPQLSSLPG